MIKSFIGSNSWIEYLPQMQVVFDQLNDAILVIDEAGKIVVANKSTAKITGFAISELVGKNQDSIVISQPDQILTRDGLVHSDRNTSIPNSTEEYPKYRTEILTKDGYKIKVEITSLNLFSESKNVSCLIIKNISEQSISTTLREINSTVSSSLSLVAVFDLLLV